MLERKQHTFTKVQTGITLANIYEMVGKKIIITIFLDNGNEEEIGISNAEEDPDNPNNILLKGSYWYSTGRSRSGVNDAPYKGVLYKDTMSGWIMPT